MKIEIPQKAAQILQTLNEAGYEAYVVGGCVRDSILNREPGDWDITTSACSNTTDRSYWSRSSSPSTRPNRRSSLRGRLTTSA